MFEVLESVKRGVEEDSDDASPESNKRQKKDEKEQLYVFLDNSNVWIEGKFAVATLEQLGIDHQSRSERVLNGFRIDYGCLLKLIMGDRELGQPALIVGSKPPSNDSLWKRCHEQRFDVKVFPRNAANQEKQVDSTLVTFACKAIYTATRGTIVLVAGDGDYKPVVEQAIEQGWKVEVWFWRSSELGKEISRGKFPNISSSGISADLRSDGRVTYRALDDCYRQFSFGSGDSGCPPLTLRVVDDAIFEWSNTHLIELMPENMFGWWDWVEDGTGLLFRFKSQAEKEMCVQLLQTKLNRPIEHNSAD